MLTIDQLLDLTMTRDPGNTNIISFDSSKLDDSEIEAEGICLHCQLNALMASNEELATEVYSLKTELEIVRKSLTALLSRSA